MNLKILKKILLGLAIISYLGVSLFAFVHVSHMEESGMQMFDCPFAFGEHALCSMDVFEHLRAWQSFSSVFVPLLKYINLALWSIILSLFFGEIRILQRLLLYARQKMNYILDFFGEIFSAGLLNPKAP